MTTFLQYVIFGFAIGAAYTLLSQGLVLTYRGAGILNFGHAALGMFGGFVFWQLEGGHAVDGTQGIQTNGGIATPWAFILSVLIVAGIGVVIHFGVMQPLRNASAVVRVVATIGILVTMEAVTNIIWGDFPILLKPFLPHRVLHAGHLNIGEDDLTLLAIAAVITAGLWAFDRYTRLGLALRGSAEKPLAAAVLGWSPNLLAAFTWAVGGALSAAAVILVGSLSGLQSDSTSLLIFPVLAASLIGGFKSFPLTLLGGVVVGVGQSLVAGYVNVPGAGDAFPLAVVVLFVLVRGSGVTVRTGSGPRRLPAIGTGRIRPVFLVGVSVIAIALLEWVFSPSVASSLSINIGWAVVFLSVVVLLGLTGQLSFEQVAMAGLAALIAGRLVHAGWPFLLACIIAILAAVPIGAIFALPAVRTQGMNLAIVTLALAVTVYSLLFSNATIIAGQSGTPIYRSQRVVGIDLDPVAHPNRYAIFGFVVLVGCCVLVANLRRGASGRRLIAVRTNERAASALGINVFAVKLYAFIVGATLAAVGGILLAFSSSTIAYGLFDPYNSALAVAYTVVGGVGYVVGPFLAAQLPAGGIGSYLIGLYWARGIIYLALLGGVLLVVYLIQDPDGLASINIRAVQHLGRLVGRRAGRRTRTGVVLDARPLGSAGSVAADGQLAADGSPGRRPRPVPASTLEVTDLTLRYGGVTALDAVSISVATGEVVGLIGPNGAGKTSLMDAISGFTRPDRGRIDLGGTAVGGWPVFRRARAGLGRSFQSVELFEGCTVQENIGTVDDRRLFPSCLRDLIRPRRLRLSPLGAAAARAVGLDGHLDDAVGDLSYGLRRLVGIARAVAMGGSVTMLDEPAAGLTGTETAELARVVRGLADDWGMGILVVEHDMGFVMEVCDRIVVLDFGRVIASGRPDEIRSDPAVVAAYLGTGVVSDRPTPAAGPARRDRAPGPGSVGSPGSAGSAVTRG